MLERARLDPKSSGLSLDFTDDIEPTVSMSTLIGCSKLLGFKQEDRFNVRNQQNPELLQLWAENASISLPDSVLDGFVVSPFDVLVEEVAGNNYFHVLEFNGTGIGGLTNLPTSVFETIRRELALQCYKYQSPDPPLVLVAISGLEDPKAPRKNKLVYEKILYVDAIQQALGRRYGRVVVNTASVKDSGVPENCAPTVIFGYMRHLLEHLTKDNEGNIYFGGRKISIVVNDRFMLNALSRVSLNAPPEDLLVLNRSYMAGADKSVAYRHLSQFQSRFAVPSFGVDCDYDMGVDSDDLLEKVWARTQQRKKTVVKPCGTGLGHGIEFFLDPSQTKASIETQLTESIKKTSLFYGLDSGAFPYAICPYVEGKVIPPGHAFSGHKFELRVVVFRHQGRISATPSIVKVSPTEFDPSQLKRSMLINNISTSSHEKGSDGKNFILPLANYDTISLLGLSVESLSQLAKDCAKLMAYSLEQLNQPVLQN